MPGAVLTVQGRRGTRLLAGPQMIMSSLLTCLFFFFLLPLFYLEAATGL